MSIPHEAAATAVKTANAATYGGSGTAIYFGLTANEIGAFGGLLIAIVGLLVSWYYKHKHYQLTKKRLADDE